MSVEEYGEMLELIDTMIQRSIDYWRKSEEGHAEYYVDAYRCVQENIKTIKAKVQSSAPIAKMLEKIPKELRWLVISTPTPWILLSLSSLRLSPTSAREEK